MDFKQKYLIAKKNGKGDILRGEEISRRIEMKYPTSAQIALLMDKDNKPEEWKTYQEFRAKVKADVDAEIGLV